MINRFLVELTEPLCDCPAGNQFALDLQVSEGVFEVQISCEVCGTHLVTPISKVKALINVIENSKKQQLNSTTIANVKKVGRPNLILIQGGAISSVPPNVKPAPTE